MIKLKTSLFGVIAGTQIDTQMGVEYLARYKIKAVGYGISKTPQEQTALQSLNKDELSRSAIEAIENLKAQGAESILIYCNSLSGAIDLNFVRRETKIKIVTPLDVYKKVAKNYNCFGVLTANCVSASNIERVLLDENKKAVVLGIGNLNLVNEVENKKPPSEILKKYRLAELLDILESNGAEVVILGCTHFSYFYNELLESTGVKIIDPSERMVEILLSD